MRTFTPPAGTRFYAGVDLHARALFVVILDHDGQVRFARNLPANPDAFLRAVAPFRDDLVVGVECMFGWYWLADRCAEQHIPFVLGHALYMKLIHGAKAKNDKIDAGKIGRLLKGGNFPMAYVYPQGMRETRDLWRRPVRRRLIRTGCPLPVRCGCCVADCQSAWTTPASRSRPG
jgi:hypothetical protein